MSGLEPPEKILSDYVEMTTLAIMFLIGAPLNLAAYTQLTERPAQSRLDILKKHLNLADLLIIFVYIPSRTCWLMTYDWRGGNLLCKVVKMFHTLAFQSSSNVIVCIAIDRLIQVLFPANNCPTRGKKRTRTMLIFSWIMALAASVPQLYVWSDYAAIPEKNWNQCLQMWEIDRLKNIGPEKALFDSEFMYSLIHLCLVFFIPAVIVFVCYVIVLSWVWINSRPALSNVRQCGSFDTTATMLTTRNSIEWNPLRTLSVSKDKPDKKNGWSFVTPHVCPSATPPKIVVSSDDGTEPLNMRPSITPSEASAVFRSNVHTGQSYQASVNRARALRVSFLLVTCYIVCWLPYNLLSLVHLLNPLLFQALFSQVYFFHQLMVFNAVLNPYLYGLFGCASKHRNHM